MKTQIGLLYEAVSLILLLRYHGFIDKGVGLGFLYPDDPLWDGQNCNGPESTCCTIPNMPWFLKTLNETTTDNIELRVCGGHGEMKIHFGI